MAKTSYERSRIAVDAVIFTMQDKSLKVLLHVREKPPFKGKKELPGGILKGNETAEQALQRKLPEITGHKDIFFQQFFTFTSPLRDPRERTVSIGFIALVNASRIGDLSGWHPCTSLPELAFDHNDIILQAKKYIRHNLSSLIARQFMPRLFPLNRLQEVYEVIEEKSYDNRNFRKKMITSGIVKESHETEKNVSHRPAKLYSFG